MGCQPFARCGCGRVETGVAQIMAILDENTLDFSSSGLEQTVRLGVRLGELLRPNDALALSGELGAGKTALAQGVGRGWGSIVRVTSPSFTIINEYPRLSDSRILHHVDCYRLSTAADVATLGLEELFDSGAAVMVEWPERIEALLPDDRLLIALQHTSPTRRGIRMKALGDRSKELLSDFRKSAFGL